MANKPSEESLKIACAIIRYLQQTLPPTAEHWRESTLDIALALDAAYQRGRSDVAREQLVGALASAAQLSSSEPSGNPGQLELSGNSGELRNAGIRAAYEVIAADGWHAGAAALIRNKFPEAFEEVPCPEIK